MTNIWDEVMQEVSREFVPSVRRTHGLVIYFKDKECVQVRFGDSAVLFHRWLVKTNRFYIENWRPFCERLQKSNTIYTLWEVMDLAQQFDISMQSPVGEGYKIPRGIKRRPSHYGNSKPRRRNVREPKGGNKTLYECIQEEKARRNHLL